MTAWAFTIARYKLIDFLRAARRHPSPLTFDDVEVAIDDRDKIEAALTVRKAVAALPDVLRRPVQATKLDGYSPRDVARQTGAPETTIRVNVHRGLKALTKFWKGEA